MKAYELYLRGRQAFVRYTKSGYQESIEWFRKAIEEDPQYALAYAAMALAWVELAESGLSDPVRAHAHAREAAAKALELDNELAEAHATLGYLQFTADFDWTRSEASFRRALELNPGVADTYDYFGRMLGSVGRFDESLEMLKRARELDPLAHRIDLATGLIRAGRYDEAIETAGHAITLDPKYPRARATLGWAYFLKGEQAEGLAAMEMAVSLAPDERGWLAQLGEAYAMAGRLDDARRVLAQLQEASQSHYVSPYHFAYVHTGLGEHDTAIGYLERALEQRAGAIYGLKGSFLFVSLRSHPRFIALLRRMNLA